MDTLSMASYTNRCSIVQIENNNSLTTSYNTLINYILRKQN